MTHSAPPAPRPTAVSRVIGVTVDARRLLCPMPVIRVQDRAQGLAPGSILRAVCTDPGALIDIPAWCRINGHRVLESRTQGEEYIVVIELAADGSGEVSGDPAA